MSRQNIRLPLLLHFERANQITRPMSAPETLHNSYAFAVLLLNLSIHAMYVLRSSDRLEANAVDSGPRRQPFLSSFDSPSDS